MVWSIVIETYLKFVTLRLFFKIWKKFQNRKKKIKIFHMNYEKSINLFEIKERLFT